MNYKKYFTKRIGKTVSLTGHRYNYSGIVECVDDRSVRLCPGLAKSKGDNSDKDDRVGCSLIPFSVIDDEWEIKDGEEIK